VPGRGGDSLHHHSPFSRHSPEFTAQEIAAETHIRGKELAKTVMVKIDTNMAMAVIAASSKVDLERLRETTGAGMVELATEEEFGGLFPECEVGAMPPFGELYDMPVFVDDLLREDEEIAFNAGSHIDLIQMSYTDYESVASAVVARIRA
jgi:Ala-tRNA(Pro) deacylase